MSANFWESDFSSDSDVQIGSHNGSPGSGGAQIQNIWVLLTCSFKCVNLHENGCINYLELTKADYNNVRLN